MFNKNKLALFLSVSILKCNGSKLSIHDYLREKYRVHPVRFNVLLTVRQIRERQGYVHLNDLQRVLDYSDSGIRVLLFWGRKTNFFTLKGTLIELSEECEVMIDDVLQYFANLSNKRVQRLNYHTARASRLHS